MKRGIIVSIQGYHQKTIAELAGEAIRAGAIALRTDKPIRVSTDLERVPVIGLHKEHVRTPSREAYITATVEALQSVARWADYVAIDYRICNAKRKELSDWCKQNKIKVVADIACMADWHSIQDLRYDFVATTLSVFHKNHRPDTKLIEELVKAGEKHIIAEGNYTTRVDVQAVLKSGAHAVCIGAAISNVYKLTRKFTTVEF